MKKRFAMFLLAFSLVVMSKLTTAQQASSIGSAQTVSDQDIQMLRTAQAAPYSSDAGLFTIASPNLGTASADLSQEGSSTSPQAQTTSTAPSASSHDDLWHVQFTPYLWFPGMHGTIGARGRDVSVHASAGDVLSHFRFGLAGTTEFRRNRIVIPIDFMWVRLEADKSLPFPDLGASSANVKVAEVLLTPEIGYRVVDHDKVKIDAVTGFRYWHIGQSLSFSPGTLNLNASEALNWVDPLVGGRIQLALSPKVTVNILGDVGGWGAGSQLEYQVAGLLGYQINPKWTLQAGYRYLDVDYRSGGTVFDVAMPGVIFGATYTFK